MVLFILALWAQKMQCQEQHMVSKISDFEIVKLKLYFWIFYTTVRSTYLNILINKYEKIHFIYHSIQMKTLPKW